MLLKLYLKALNCKSTKTSRKNWNLTTNSDHQLTEINDLNSTMVGQAYSLTTVLWVNNSYFYFFKR